MAIHSLTISQFRNIPSLRVTLSPDINLFHGANGSGKTSVLEAVHLLSLARSFRTSQFKHYIQQGEERCTLFAEVNTLASQQHLPVGLQRARGGDLSIRIAGANVERVSTLAELLPVQLINSDTFLLLEGSPAIRRQYMDWGGFHIEAQFLQVWKSVKRILKQRNSLLKHGKIADAVREAWDAEFIRYAEQLDRYRNDYVEALKPCFEQVLGELISLPDLTLQYYRGWDRKRDLNEVLAEGFQRDLQAGFSHSGPQRADLRVRVNNLPAAEILSRGQQKLVVSALKVAQGLLLKQLSGRDCLYLIDDLPAELDQQHRQRLCQLLVDMQSQLLVTCVDAEAFRDCWSSAAEVKQFHISGGNLIENHCDGVTHERRK